MKNYLRLSILALLIIFVLALVAPISVVAEDQPSFPESINGFPVIFVQTSANTPDLAVGDAILVLLDKAATPEESIAKLNLAEYVNKNPLPKGWSIEVTGGKNVTKESYAKLHEENNGFRKISNRFKLFSSPSSDVKSLTTIPQASYSIDANKDPISQAIVSQSAFWNAVAVGNNQDQGSAFLNNGLINPSTSYLIQVGHYYVNGTGYNIYAYKDYNNYQPIVFNFLYYSTHYYRFVLQYQNPYWYFKCQDTNTGDWIYAVRSITAGNRMYYNSSQPWTSLFFENYNVSSTWYSGFSPTTITAYVAQDGTSSPPNKKWDSEQIWIQSCRVWIPNSNPVKITGSLLNYGSATWNLPNLPLGCW